MRINGAFTADRLQIDAITVGALVIILFCSTNFGLQTTNGFTLPGEIRLCASPHTALTGAAASQPKIACVSSMEELGVIFAGVVAAAWLTPT
jgi:hypothetical protein